LKVIWTDAARHNLRAIRRRVSRVSEDAGLRTADSITRRTAQLSAFPDSGRMAPEFGNRYIRELIEGDYRILYERFADRIEVIGVIHGARSFAEGAGQD
jgi:plasmid stabilization system protein ParE